MKLDLILEKLDGEGIKHLRESHNISQEALARKLQISPKTVWRWEKGNRISPLARYRLKEVFGDYFSSDEFYARYMKA